MQTKKQSLIETCTNISIGYLISTVANYLILPLFGYTVNIGKSAIIGLIFSVISIIRSYLVRRAFERLSR